MLLSTRMLEKVLKSFARRDATESLTVARAELMCRQSEVLMFNRLVDRAYLLYEKRSI